MIDVGIVTVLLIAFCISSLKVTTTDMSTWIMGMVGVIASIPVLVAAGKAVIKRKISVDLLASIALLVSCVYHEWSSVAFIALMITCARLFSRYTDAEAKKTIQRLLKLRPEKAKRKRKGNVEIVPISAIQVGDEIIIEAGEQIPVDGVIIEGVAAIDESTITGESIPVHKTVKDHVLSATINTAGSLIVVVTRVGDDTTFAKIIKLVEGAQKQKTGITGVADIFASYYIAITVLASVGLYLYTRDHFLVLSLLLVTCADDIAVAIPLAFLASITRAAKEGIIVKGGTYLERLTKVKTVVLDKTGTVTLGKIVVQSCTPVSPFTKQQVLTAASALAQESSHPVSIAIMKEMKKMNITPAVAKNVHEVPGKGITGDVEKSKVVVGKKEFVKEKGVVLSDRVSQEYDQLVKGGYSIVVVAVGKKILGFVTVADDIRPHIKQSLLQLKSFGVNSLIMLTGDNEYVAKRVADTVGIEDYKYGLLPEQKVSIVQDLKQQKDQRLVAMVGDGVNDAAALTAADVGISMGGIGSDAAIESSDIALMHDDISKIADVVLIGKNTMHIAYQNFFIWGLVNAVGVALVFSGVFSPKEAAAYNFFTDFLPLLNSFRLFGKKIH